MKRLIEFITAAWFIVAAIIGIIFYSISKIFRILSYICFNDMYSVKNEIIDL